MVPARLATRPGGGPRDRPGGPASLDGPPVDTRRDGDVPRARRPTRTCPRAPGVAALARDRAGPIAAARGRERSGEARGARGSRGREHHPPAWWDRGRRLAGAAV